MILIEYAKKLSATNIKYILAINDLFKQDGKQVRSIDVARQLHLSKPSVHVMLNTLSEMSIIAKNQKGMLEFTAEGRKLACKYTKYYEAWQSYLDKGISDSERRKSAICAIIAELSEEENKIISDRI